MSMIGIGATGRRTVPWAVVEKAQLVIYGMQAADVTVMVQNVLDSGKHVPHREVDRTARWASRD